MRNLVIGSSLAVCAAAAAVLTPMHFTGRELVDRAPSNRLAKINQTNDLGVTDPYTRAEILTGISKNPTYHDQCIGHPLTQFHMTVVVFKNGKAENVRVKISCSPRPDDKLNIGVKFPDGRPITINARISSLPRPEFTAH